MQNYSYYSPQIKSSQGLNNYEQAFAQHNPITSRPSFINNGKLLHNNVAENILTEQIKEYRINIDSADRNITTYPNQFNFQVSFGGVGTPSPVIPRVFKNVKYIKLDEVRLPKAFHIEDSGGGNWIVSTGTDYQFINERYLIIKIAELGNSNIYATNNVFADGSFILIYDKVLNTYFTIYLTSNNIYTYSDSQLFNLSCMTIQLMNINGTIYQINDTTTSVPITDVRNPSYPKLQMGLSFVIGVLQNEMDTDTTYG